MRPAWKVTGHDARGRAIGRSVYLRAATRERAERAGRALLAMFGVRPRGVSAVPWSPETDHELVAHCRRNGGAS